MKTYAMLFCVAALLSWLLTPLVIRLGHRLHAYGHSREQGNAIAVPRLGGIAVYAAVLLTGDLFLVTAATGGADVLGDRFTLHWQTAAMLLVPATLVLLLGIYDDLRGTKPWQKLLVESTAAAIAWVTGSRILSVPLLGYLIHSAVLSFLLTLVWVVTVTNAFNLIDGLDGLATGVAFFVAFDLFLVSLMQANLLGAVLTITLAGALVGFLRYNFAPAKIFLGDAGSLSLGFLLAVLAVRASLKSSTVVEIVVPYVAFGLPLFDTSLAVVRRFLSGRSLFQADCNHIHHRLLGGRSTPWSVVLKLYALAAFFCVGSLLILRSTGSLIMLLATLASVSAWLLFRRLCYEELSQLGKHVFHALRTQRHVLANEILIRKVAKQIESAAGLERSWQLLIETLATLEFDEIAVRLTVHQSDPVPFLSPWQRDGLAADEKAWMASIPLGGEKQLGQLRLRRAIRNDRLLFHFSSLLETLLPPFERQLAHLYDHRESAPLLEYALPSMGQRLRRTILVNERGKE